LPEFSCFLSQIGNGGVVPLFLSPTASSRTVLATSESRTFPSLDFQCSPDPGSLNKSMCDFDFEWTPELPVLLLFEDEPKAGIDHQMAD